MLMGTDNLIVMHSTADDHDNLLKIYKIDQGIDDLVTVIWYLCYLLLMMVLVMWK